MIMDDLELSRRIILALGFVALFCAACRWALNRVVGEDEHDDD